MRTITTITDLYKFDELSKDAKYKVLSKLIDINTQGEWWDSVYYDAENIGLKITSFGLDRNRSAEGKFITNAIECAEKILIEHGKCCQTYTTAKTFLSYVNTVSEREEKSTFDEENKENTIKELKDIFLRNILEDYSIILQKEYEYLYSDEAIIETIYANDYEFTKDGEQY